jgi:hypothetical protein
MTVNEKIRELCLTAMLRPNSEERRGQALFNALYSMNQELAEEIRNTEYDPYFDDTKILACIEYIGKKL